MVLLLSPRTYFCTPVCQKANATDNIDCRADLWLVKKLEESLEFLLHHLSGKLAYKSKLVFNEVKILGLSKRGEHYHISVLIAVAFKRRKMTFYYP